MYPLVWLLILIDGLASGNSLCKLEMVVREVDFRVKFPVTMLDMPVRLAYKIGNMSSTNLVSYETLNHSVFWATVFRT